MSAESLTNAPERNELEEDAAIEAEAIMAQARAQHNKLEKHISQIPADEVDDIVALAQVFDEALTKLNEIHQSIISGDPIDLESELVELRKFSEVLDSAQKSIFELTTKIDTLPPADEPDTIPAPVEDMSPTNQAVEIKTEAPVKERPVVQAAPARKRVKLHDQHVKDLRVLQLTSENPFEILLADAPEDKRRPKKTLLDLQKDIKTAFEAERIPKAEADAFFAESGVFELQRNEIKSLLALLNSEVNNTKNRNNTKSAEYREKINEAYMQIRNEALALVMTSRADKAERRQNQEDGPSLSQRGIEDIKGDIDTARFYLDELSQRHVGNDEFLASSEYKRVVGIFKLADDCNDPDSNILNHKLETYLAGLWPALDELTNKFTVGAGAESSDPAVPESEDNTASAEPDVDLGKSEPVISELAEPDLPKASSYELAVLAPSERTIQREKSLEAKQELRDVEKRYYDALEVYQNEANSRSLFAKIKSLGIKPDLPEAVKALEAEYLARRKDYAHELDARLGQRGEKFELSQDDMKRAFARKFILRPQEELLKLQESNFLSREAQGRIKRIAAVLAKNRWAVRAGSVALAGVLGAASGGTVLAFAGAAGLQGIKIASSAGAATLTCGITNILTQKLVVDKTAANLKKTTENVETNFNIEGMGALAGELIRDTERNIAAENFQKFTTAVGGGWAGYATGSGISNYLPEVVNGAGLRAEALGKLETSKIVPKVIDTPETSKLGVTIEASAQPTFVKDIALPFDSREGGLVYEHHVKDVSFGPEFKPAALTDADTKALNSFMRVKLDDILSDKPNTPVPEVERQLQAAIQKSFGDSRWWSDAPIKSVDIGKLEVVLVSGNPSAPNIINGEYVVQKGDTLWEIAEDKFKDQLKDLEPNERKEVLGRLFERVKADSGLVESLSLDSNNIDKIYAGEKIELGGLQSELTQVLEDREIIEQFRTSGPLSVEADGGVKSVPITVVEKPIPGGTEVFVDNGHSYTEATPAKPVITPEITTSTKSFYETAPQHVRDEIRQHFASPRDFEGAVERAADRVSSRAYDFLDTSFNNYESPYNLVREMTLERFENEIMTKSNPELRFFLAENKIKYEAFLEWQDKIKELRNNIPHTKTDTIGSMFEQSVFQDKVTEQANRNLYRN